MKGIVTSSVAITAAATAIIAVDTTIPAGLTLHVIAM